MVGGIVFAISTAAFSRVPLLPELGGELSLTVGEIGLLTTAFGAGRLLVDLPAGRLAAGVAPAVAFAIAGGALAASSVLLATSASLAQAVVASMLMGSVSALTNTVGMYSFAISGGAAGRGASMAMFTSALMLGQMVGPALGGALGSLTDWRVAIALTGAIGVVVLAVCIARRRADGSGTGLGSRIGAQPADPARAEALGTEGVPPSRAELIAIAAAPFATFFAIAGLTQTLIPVIGKTELGLSPATIGVAIGAGVAARFIGTWVAGIGSDRLSRRIVLVPTLALMSLGAGALALPLDVGVWVAAILLLALGSSGISVAAATLADRVPPPALGPELGQFRLVGEVGLVLGPLVAGFLYQESGPGLAAAASAGVFATAAVVALVWIREPPRLEEERRRAVRRKDRTGELLVD
jgi:MFS family permease